MIMENKVYSRVVDGVTIEWQELNQWWVLKSMGGITIKGKIYFRDAHEFKRDKKLRHEYTHVLQQGELGYYVFLLFYCFQWLVGFFSFKKAYTHIKFEREAYLNQSTLNYLKTRPAMAWKNY